jgi:hypothetical protein
MKRILLVLVALGVLAAWPAASGAATFKGTVVAKERGKLLVASPAGVIQAVSGHATMGSRVVVQAGSVKVIGRVHTAHIRGIVVRRVGTTMVLSSNHHLVAVRHAARKLASASDTTPVPGTTPSVAPAAGTAPAPGAVVSTNVTIANGGLDEDDSEVVGQAGSVAIQAQVVSVAAGTVTLLVNGVNVPVTLPAGLTLPASIVGQMVSLTLNLNDQNDDNETDDSGDDSGDNGNSGNSSGNGDHGGGGGGDD